MTFDPLSRPSDMPADMRASRRLESDRQAECRVEGKTFRVALYNVSVSGCMIEMPMNRIAQGERVHLTTEGRIRMSAVVVWQEGCNAGLRFDQPLHEAVVRFLGYDPTSATPALPTDRFGRPLPKLRENERSFSRNW